MRNLFTSTQWEFSEEPGVIVLRLHSTPARLTLDRIRSCGFRLDGQRKAFVRKADANGRHAAEYLRKQLEEDL
jgi:hypothetical protein